MSSTNTAAVRGLSTKLESSSIYGVNYAHIYTALTERKSNHCGWHQAVT